MGGGTKFQCAEINESVLKIDHFWEGSTIRCRVVTNQGGATKIVT